MSVFRAVWLLDNKTNKNFCCPLSQTLQGLKEGTLCIMCCETGSVEKIRFVAEVGKHTLRDSSAVTLLPYGTTRAQPQIPAPLDPSSPPPPPLLPPPRVTHSNCHPSPKPQSLTGHFKVGGQDPHYHKCVCVSVWQSDHGGSLQTEPTPPSRTIDQCPRLPERQQRKKEQHGKGGREREQEK